MNKHFNRAQHDNIVRGLFRPTALSRALAAFKAWQSRRIAIRELSAMPDALLRDIGIERFQIKDAVRNFGVAGLRRPSVYKMPVGKKIAAAVQPVQKAA